MRSDQLYKSYRPKDIDIECSIDSFLTCIRCLGFKNVELATESTYPSDL